MGGLPELHHPRLAEDLDEWHEVGEVLVRGLDELRAVRLLQPDPDELRLIGEMRKPV